MPTYRYKQQHVSITDISRFVPGSLALVAQGPEVFVDISGSLESKTDLDEEMLRRGYLFDTTDPVVGPAAQSTAVTPSYVIEDDFVLGNIDSDELGKMGWRAGAVGAGSLSAATSSAGHPGVLSINAGTTDASISAIYLGETNIESFVLGTTQNELWMEWLVAFNANALNSTHTERFAVGFGLSWNAAAGTEQANGVYWEMAPGTSANIQLVTANASTRTKGSSGVAPSAGYWYRIGIKITYPGSVPTATLYINGIEKVSQTTNFPVTRLGVGARGDAAAGGSAGIMDVDYCRVWQVTNRET